MERPQGESEQAQKSALWRVAIGLQDVDGLKTSGYLLEAAREHIKGNIDMNEVKKWIQAYYEEQKDRLTDAKEKMLEADLVSLHMVILLGERTFQFSPASYMNIHEQLFTGIFPHAGQMRSCNITKNEWVLDGKSVYYASYDVIGDALDYIFQQEKRFSYKAISNADVVKHIAAFTSDIWQIHPFCEGNTRTTAVFLIQYLNALGFQVNTDVFEDHACYFRNALVRSNYNNLPLGIYATTKYLEQFFENMLMDANHELKNRHLHVNFSK